MGGAACQRPAPGVSLGACEAGPRRVNPDSVVHVEAHRRVAGLVGTAARRDDERVEDKGVGRGVAESLEERREEGVRAVHKVRVAELRGALRVEFQHKSAGFGEALAEVLPLQRRQRGLEVAPEAAQLVLAHRMLLQRHQLLRRRNGPHGDAGHELAVLAAAKDEADGEYGPLVLDECQEHGG